MKKIFTLVIFFIMTSHVYSQPSTWTEQTPIPAPPPLRSVSAVSLNVCWISGDNGVILYTSNGGINWVYRTSSLIGTNSVPVICGIDSVSALCCFKNTTNAFILRTSDRGLNWVPVYIQFEGSIDDIIMSSPLTGFAYGDPLNGKWTLLKTTNGGLVFDSTGPSLPQSGLEHGWFNAMAVNGNYIWFGTNNSRVYFSTNFGISWGFGTLLSQNAYCVAFNNYTGFCAAEQSYSSTNSGISWLPIVLPGSGNIYTFTNLSSQFWYGRGNQIYYSSNNGSSFNLQYDNPSSGTYTNMSFIFSSQENILSTIRGWGVTNNGAISAYQQTSIGIKPISNKIPNQFRLYQNYPNPFNLSTKIAFDVPRLSFTKLIIFDILGREMTSPVNEQLIPGHYEVNFEAASYPSGVYSYRLTTDWFVETKKMVLIK